MWAFVVRHDHTIGNWGRLEWMSRDLCIPGLCRVCLPACNLFPRKALRDLNAIRDRPLWARPLWASHGGQGHTSPGFSANPSSASGWNEVLVPVPSLPGIAPSSKTDSQWRQHHRRNYVDNHVGGPLAEMRSARSTRSIRDYHPRSL